MMARDGSRRFSEARAGSRAVLRQAQAARDGPWRLEMVESGRGGGFAEEARARRRAEKARGGLRRRPQGGSWWISRVAQRNGCSVLKACPA
jgi:hypothetical protein